MKPVYTLYDIFGPKYVFNGKGSYYNSQWLPDEDSQNLSTGRLLTLAGKTPLIIHKHLVNSLALSTLSHAGLQVAENLYVYKDQRSYNHLLQNLQKKKQDMVFNFDHLPSEYDKKKYWIKSSLLCYLNNKKHLEEIVPTHYVPERFVVTIDELEKEKFDISYPFVIKAATDEPGGGGLEVMMCKNKDQFIKAKKMFKSSKFVIVERFLSIKKNFCIQFAQTYKGNLVYLGSAEQIIDNNGKYVGNWIEKRDEPPAEAINLCKRIVEKAVSLGYWGLIGIDTVITEDDEIFVIDLNFRENGSAAALLYRESIMKNWKVNTIKTRKWKSLLRTEDFHSTVQTFINKKNLLPLCIYNDSNTIDNPIYMWGIIAGCSKKEINRIEQEMKNRGIM
ncbi:ATP-grasp domain-containing protein [Bacillus sp. FJAT-44742]|uniref:ATP-grasp domain-containing protein n=1 Tax=Bacillus sp. FJAT-44742 TaxID=2014005 RepID=UPI000C234F9B|nr:ATP-grasp domain-containing protein [Bacillus sp. FJAT-44742]